MYAVFPLNVVVLPEESVALHIFEPRYRQLFQDYKSGKPFVILHSGSKGLAKIGSLVSIEEIIKEFPDGTIDIVVKGIAPIQINKFIPLYPSKLYSAVEGSELPVFSKANNALIEKSIPYFNSIKRKINSKEFISTYSIARMLCLEEDSKLLLLASNSNQEINQLLLNELKLLATMYNQEMQLKERIFLN